MSRSDRWPDDYEPELPKSRSGSRRGSASLSRRNSAAKKAPLATSSATSTPKKTRNQAPELVVTGRPCLRKSDRANSLPGAARRPSVESVKFRKPESPRRLETSSSRSQETSLEDDASLDLSQVSDFEDNNSKYGVKQKIRGLATSTPKDSRSKLRSGSLQHHTQQVDFARSQKSLDFTQDTFTSSRNSVYVSSSAASTYRYGGASTEVECSSASAGSGSEEVSPRPKDLPSGWQQWGAGGEWSSFWARYSGRAPHSPHSPHTAHTPHTPRREDIDLADLELSTDGSAKRSPDNIDLNCILKSEGLHLTPKETQNIIKCAHILGNVLSSAIERHCRDKDDSRVSEVMTERENIDVDKRNLTLDLRETNLPAEVEEEKRQETVTTQTDISLPNTRSAPRIFEKILRQLSKSSLDEGKTIEAKNAKDVLKKEA